MPRECRDPLASLLRSLDLGIRRRTRTALRHRQAAPNDPYSARASVAVCVELLLVRQLDDCDELVDSARIGADLAA